MAIQDIIDTLNEMKDEGVPKNIAKQISDIVTTLNDSSIEENSKIHKALSILDDISNDINLASHIKMQFWNISSLLEKMLK